MRNVYDNFASDWNARKTELLSPMKLFLPLVRKRDVILDAGCGTGRHLLPLAKRSLRVEGFDSSKEMLKYARRKLIEGQVKEVKLTKEDIVGTHLPSSTYDKIFCIAVLHHLRSRKRRIMALKEMYRLLKPGGMLLVSVWNYYQPRFKGKKKSCFIAWKITTGKSYNRYYYFFEKDELELLAKKACFLIKSSYFELNGSKHRRNGASNLCIVLKKAPA